jgi:hypothetical protein
MSAMKVMTGDHSLCFAVVNSRVISILTWQLSKTKTFAWLGSSLLTVRLISVFHSRKYL